MHRRELLKGMLWGSAAVAAIPLGRVSARPAIDGAGAQLAMLERRSGGRLGVAILDTGNGRQAAYRNDERFLMCSTFKLLLTATVLARVDRGTETLGRRVVFASDALLEWAPVTRKHAGPPGMTVAQLCAAAVTQSDNTAANVLLHAVGGPPAVTAFAHGLGDAVTRLDRTEPTLNRPHGDWDTTTPSAMLANMRRLLLGDALSTASRTRLTDWLLQCQTGAKSLRAGLPASWREGDKTGTGDTATNDIAILWPPGRKPLLVTAYYENPQLAVKDRYPVLAEVGRIIATQMA